MPQYCVLLCCCLAALASADKLGYNYQPPANAAASNVSPSYSSDPGPTIGSTNSGQTQPSSAGPRNRTIGSIAETPNYSAAKPELQKEFFTFTANDEDFYDPAESERLSNSLNKALRVIFVKGPDGNRLEKAIFDLAKQSAAQETAIYVLTSQAEIEDLAKKLNDIRSSNSSNNQPEVHFVKYSTPEDAAHAQQAIQGQYDRLGGASSQQDGGVAPTLSFASSQPAPVAARPTASASNPRRTKPAARGSVSSYLRPVTPSKTYLPAKVVRRSRS